MKHGTLIAVAASLAFAAGAAAAQQAVVNQPAPSFTAQDTSGKTVSLADFKGRYVVLEWTNPGCPFVQKHYNSANMPATQKDALGKGAVWLTVSSTAKDAGDWRPPAELIGWLQSKSAKTTATLLDEDGRIGRSYGARTTPHMYLIDPHGKLVYAGAIDSKPTANPADISSATNYVRQALDEVLAGKPVSQPQTRAYGCSIKYASAG
ncbi:thioredoxin family protein [Aquabacterium humicola]|uniref:thioredoxin family protein n=1 Tax=Aquabacterium humicola TaxID=3237377 RepID=UPI00254322A8|nr:thioredoxin family protein [Rubrivivax pictus]